MKFRRFTPAGLAAASEFLAKAKETSSLDLAARDALIFAPALTEPVPGLADVEFDETRVFDTTFSFCEYMHSIIGDRKPQEYHEDAGFWTYLAFAYINQLVGESQGKVKIGAEARLVYSTVSHMTGHRHLLCYPYYLYNAYKDTPEICRVVLWHRPSIYNDLVEQLLSRQFIVQNPAFLRTANVLYFDARKMSTKRGAAGDGRGGVRRFVAMVDQFAMTRDFFDMKDADEFLTLLPAEFERFYDKDDFEKV